MKRYIGSVFGALLIVTLIGCASGEAVGQEDLSEALDQIVDSGDAPSIAAAVIKDGTVVFEYVAGERRPGEPVAERDPYHIGSNTKAMTAVLIATLVDDGLIDWDSTLGDVLPDVARGTPYEESTVWQLLDHTSGIPNPFEPAWFSRWQTDGLTAPEQRLDMAGYVLAKDPVAEPGRRFLYSNFGYVIAGLVVDRVAGRSYEDVFADRLAAPLGWTTWGWGAPAAEGPGPWGHNDGPVDPSGFGADNPVGFNSAGRLHLSLRDQVRYVQLVLREFVTEDGQRLVSEESFARLMDGGRNGYAGGWGTERRGGDLIRITHNGSNTMFFTTYELFPRSNSAVVVNVNRGDQRGQDATFRVLDLFKGAFEL